MGKKTKSNNKNFQNDLVKKVDSKVKLDEDIEFENLEISLDKKNVIQKVKKSKTLCLNMIVKNESHIIKETLDCVCKYIDYWVICDTGSTDGTQDLIKNFFKEKGIPGELHQDEWKNFGHNRSLAFKYAFNKTDYVWVIDADDLVVGEIVFPSSWDKDYYFLKFGTGFVYERQQIFNNRLKWMYKGVLHEFPQCINKQQLTMGHMHENFYIDSRRLGDRSKDPKKYLKDAEVLVKAIDEEPDMKVRYTFYAAQSYKDYGDFENSVKYYKKRIEQGGWNEELFISWMEVGNGLVRLGKDKKEIIDAYLNGFKTLSQRSETLFLLGEYYFNSNDLENAHKVCKLGLRIKLPTEQKLFLQADVYEWKFKELFYRVLIGIREVKLQIKNLTEEELNNEIDELFKFLTTNPIVPDYAKQRIRSFNNSLALENITSIPEGYDFYPGEDSFGSDIGHFPSKTIEELAEIAELYDNCVGFNSYGYLKFEITSKDKFIKINPLLYKNDGLFIKKSKLEEINKNKEERKKSYEKFSVYNNELIEKITKQINDNKNNSKNNITLTITTCKRFDLFERTINSFINCCKDIIQIDKFICIDDNSSESDRQKMKELYPFFTWVFKTPEQRGHIESMNMIIDMVDSEYLIHLEDDWLFYEEYDYITKSIEILSENKIIPTSDIPSNQQIENKEIAQILFNKNYTEIEETIVRGGYPCKTSSGLTYLLHEYYDPNTDKDSYAKAVSKYPGVGTCIYWPHYSFRPSIIKTKIFKQLGKYSNSNGFFEMDYAKRFVQNNYVSVFFDKVVCRHIGKLTSEKNNDKTKNAYALNEVDQFGSSDNNTTTKSNEKYKIYCINLEQRVDRKNLVIKEFQNTNLKNLEFFKAVYGKNIKPNKSLAKLFYGNDFGNRKGVVGCALSHVSLWTKLVESSQDYFYIFEDDIKLTQDFDDKFKLINDYVEKNKDSFDYLFLGYHMFNTDKEKYSEKYYNVVNKELVIENLNKDIYVGGFFSYVITKRGAINILKYIINNGIKHGIDYLLKVHNFVCLELSPFIVLSDWVTNLNSSVDSDIQKNFESLELDFSNIKYENIPDNQLTDNFILMYYRNIINQLNSKTNLSFDISIINNSMNYNMIVGFHTNQLSERGTEIALYDYANHNEKILGNKSIIFYQKNNPNNCEQVIQKFTNRFNCYGYTNYSDVDKIVLEEKIDLVYFIKYGNNDNLQLNNCPTVNHAVFVPEPHGYKYAVLVDWTNKKFGSNCPVVPHMIDMPDYDENLRYKLGIPTDAIVLGRYGGFEQFDIGFVHDAIKIYLLEPNPNIYFLFANTKEFHSHSNIIYLDKIIDVKEKAKFINTCDAMLHARSDGETFGLAIGEFCRYNKPIITSYSSIDNSHIEILKDKCIIYNNKNELINIFKNIITMIKSKDFTNPYSEYSPENVMKIFYDVFLKDYVELKSSLKFHQRLDIIGFDVGYVGRKGINQFIWEAIKNPQINCFNTLGYLKNNFCIDNLENSKYFGENDGLWEISSRTVKLDKNIRVKLLCNWQDSKKLCDEWVNLTQGNYKWNNITFTWDDHNIDYWVIINYPPPNAQFILNKTILFHMEPWCADPEQSWGVKTWGSWSNPDPSKFMSLRTHKYAYNNATWQLKLTYTQLKTNSITKSNELGNKISSICSSKYVDPGHKKRVDFIKYIEEKSDPIVQIDVWGFDNKLGFKNYRGSCPSDNKDIGIVPYKYYLIAENNIEHNYISEKFWEPILAECLVFYYGCPNVTDYIDSKAFVSIDLTKNFDEVFEIISNAIKNNLWEERLPYIKEAKQKILDYYNFCPTVERIISESQN